MRRWKTGILGTGVISRTYASDIRTFYNRRLDLVACADIDLSRASALASEFGIPKACSPEVLLADPEIDIVIDLPPPQAHVEMNRKIIEAGKHLFSEKPFAPTVFLVRDHPASWR